MKRLIVLFLLIPLIVTSCAKRDEKVVDEKKLKVVTSLFPLYDFAKNIGRQKADVTLLLPPGVEPHSFEPKPGDIIRINEADIFIFTGRYMEPWVEDILKGIGSQGPLIVDSSKDITLMEGNKQIEHEHKHEYGKIDPHIWLDFSNVEKIVDNILEGFLKKDPANKELYLKNAEEYKTKINELDKGFRDSLSSCKKDLIIHGGHFAFGYLAKRYNLKYLSAYRGFSPDTEPTPMDLIELSKKLKKNDLKYVFYEELINPKVSEAISRETGAKLLMLHGAHNVTRDELNRGVTFISLMEQNLRNLKIGLECR
ncbi:MAG: zinc ABC transporter substrate-binding protein [Thermodesulfovibrionales bacterium]|nr:zinc ABC transporter substrate-binding protein [Thermodesulfovibrionales bacterium]